MGRDEGISEGLRGFDSLIGGSCAVHSEEFLVSFFGGDDFRSFFHALILRFELVEPGFGFSWVTEMKINFGGVWILE